MFDTEERWCTSDEQIAQVAESYFQEFFSTAHPQNIESVLQSIQRKVTPHMNESLTHPYTADEVKLALFQMHPSKLPRSNGMSPFFFQKYWHIVGNDVTEAILSVLRSGHMLKKMNHTYIVLIPKKKDPKYLANYRLISLSNVVSRIISMVIANHSKHILPNVISDS